MAFFFVFWGEGIFYLGRWSFGMWMEFCFAFSYAGFWVGLVGVFEVFFFFWAFDIYELEGFYCMGKG